MTERLSAGTPQNPDGALLKIWIAASGRSKCSRRKSV